VGFPYLKTGLNGNTEQGLSTFTPIAQGLPDQGESGRKVAGRSLSSNRMLWGVLQTQVDRCGDLATDCSSEPRCRDAILESGAINGGRSK